MNEIKGREVIVCATRSSIVGGAVGARPSIPSVWLVLPAETQLTQSAEPPKAKTTVLLTQKLEGLPGFSVQVVLVEGPPGWVGGRHYHPGHVFVYMLDGTYQLNYDDLTSRTVLPGEVFYEAPNTIMRFCLDRPDSLCIAFPPAQ